MRGLLVGAGYISRRHLAAWRRVGGVEIVGVCDVVRKRAEERAREFGIGAVFCDAGEALAKLKPEFVDIATGPEAHLPLARLAAQAGAHMLVQKPLAPSIEEARAIAEAARAGGVRARVLEMWRYLPEWQTLARVLGEKPVGEAYFVRLSGRGGLRRSAPVNENQPYFKDMPRLLVYEMWVHYLDCLRWLFGEVEKVFAVGRRVNRMLRGEDFAQAMLLFRSGAVCCIDHSWAHEPQSGLQEPLRVRVEGPEGRVEMCEGGRMVEVRRAGEGQRRIPVERGPEPFVEAMAACQRDFIEGLRAGREFESTIEDNIRTLSVAFAIYQSMEEERAVCVEELAARGGSSPTR